MTWFMRLWRRKRGRPDAGFTLVEVLVAVGILTALAGLVGGSVAQVLSLERFWREDVRATRDWRHAGSWFARDAFQAESTTLTDGAPPVEEVTLSWSDEADQEHTVTYSLVGNNLVRNADGNPITVARKVVDVAFALSGQVLTFALELAAEGGDTERMTLDLFLRMLQ